MSKAKGGGRDLTLIGGADRHVRLPLSKWSSTGVLREGYGVDFFSAPGGVLGFQSNVSFQDGFSLSPLGDIVPEAERSGRRERGFG
ncbi:hypothetical protein DIM_05920 [Candidatus Denitrolinea symbiosum]|nr:hypothetical protein DIM_05920 [Candidatus Denitrolinea symbiosum]